MKYLNIPSNYDFLLTLYRYISDEYCQNKDYLNKVLILLPTRRAVNRFREIFLRNLGKTPLVLSIYDLLFVNLCYKSIPTLLDDFKINISEEDDIRNRLTLVNILKKKFLLQDHTSLLRISDELKEILQTLAWNDIEMDSAYAYLQEEYNMQSDLYNKLCEVVRECAYTNGELTLVKLIKFYTELFKSSRPDYDIIFAGNWCPNKIILGLVSVLSKYDNTSIVFNLPKNIFEEESFNNLESINPYYAYMEFIKNLGISRLEDIQYGEYELINNLSANSIYCSVLPSDLIYDRWSRIKDLGDLNNINLLECKDKLEEVDLIKYIVNKNLLIKKDIKIAIVASQETSREIFNHIKYLDNVKCVSGFSKSIMNTKVARIIIEIIELYLDNFTPNKFISFLKNRCLNFGYDKTEYTNLVEILEGYILQNSFMVFNSISAYKTLVSHIDNTENRNKLSFFLEKISGVFDSIFRDKRDFSSILERHLEFLNKFCDIKILGEEDVSGYTQVLELLNKVLTSYQDGHSFFIKDIKDYLNVIKFFLNKCYYETELESPNVTILSIHEIQLIHYDLVILTGMNEGEFTGTSLNNFWSLVYSNTPSDGFYEDFKWGNLCFNFVQSLFNKQVIITRAITNGNIAFMKSRFLSRLEALLKFKNLSFNQDKKYLEDLMLQGQGQKRVKIDRPSPKPPIIYRPDNFTLNDYIRLIKNPYEVYCSHILKLKKQNNFYKQNFGLDLDKLLVNIFISSCKDLEDKDRLQALRDVAKKFLDGYSKNETFRRILVSKFALLERNLLELQNDFVNSRSEYFLDKKISANIKGYTISTRFDALRYDENGVSIFNYRANQVPSLPAILRLEYLQPILQALVLKYSGLSKKGIQSINYLSIRQNKRSVLDSHDKIINTMNYVEDLMGRLVNYFNKIEGSYLATRDLVNTDYSHISRLDEWNKDDYQYN